jgi:rare lipoprotein A (peptidoglycan hydrolase)
MGGAARHRKRAAIGAAAVLAVTGIAAAAFAFSTADSQAATENCGGLDTALRNNLNFIAGQQANPDAQSAGRIANRQAVVDLIQQRRTVAGCTAQVAADQGIAKPTTTKPVATAKPAEPVKQPAGGAASQVVCAGSTVTLSGEGGEPAASSNQFPVGTTLKVTNLDNNKSTTVKVTSASGSCALLNDAAFEQVREPGKFLIRKARIERVG